MLTQRASKAAAWCSPELTSAARELWIEGEWNGAAVALGLEASGYGGAVGVQGVAGLRGWPHTAHLTPGREVYIYADPDKAGDSARAKWAALAHSLGAKVFSCPVICLEAGTPATSYPPWERKRWGPRSAKA